MGVTKEKIMYLLYYFVVFGRFMLLMVMFMHMETLVSQCYDYLLCISFFANRGQFGCLETIESLLGNDK